MGIGYRLSYTELPLMNLEKRMKLFSSRNCLQGHYTQPRKLFNAAEQTPHSFIHSLKKTKILFKPGCELKIETCKGALILKPCLAACKWMWVRFIVCSWILYFFKKHWHLRHTKKNDLRGTTSNASQKLCSNRFGLLTLATHWLKVWIMCCTGPDWWGGSPDSLAPAPRHCWMSSKGTEQTQPLLSPELLRGRGEALAQQCPAGNFPFQDMRKVLCCSVLGAWTKLLLPLSPSTRLWFLEAGYA